MNLDTINKLYLELSQVATAKTAREIELEDVLTSARAICQRGGADTAWGRFDERIARLGIGFVTPRVFKVLPSDLETRFAVGDIVQNEFGPRATNGCPLVCWSGAYDDAIVVSVEPFVLVSRAGDMLWSCIGDRREHLVVIGHATEEESQKAFERFRGGR